MGSSSIMSSSSSSTSKPSSSSTVICFIFLCFGLFSKPNQCYSIVYYILALNSCDSLEWARVGRYLNFHLYAYSFPDHINVTVWYFYILALNSCNSLECTLPPSRSVPAPRSVPALRGRALALAQAPTVEVLHPVLLGTISSSLQ